MSSKVAVVTGSNKGIGFAIVKGLCQRFDGVVYLTSRSEERGKEAVAELEKQGLYPRYHQLDVSDTVSVEKFRDHIKKNHKGIDILINNAGIAFVSFLKKNKYKNCSAVIDINYRGVVRVEELLYPLLNDNARVLNISSDCGHLSNIRNKHWIERLSKKDLLRSDIEDFVNWYLDSVRNGTFDKRNFADYGTIAEYRASKVAVSALSKVQQRELDFKGIIVNSMHPGLVSTDMTSGIGFFTTDDAAKTPLYLVLEAPNTLKGAYVWFDGKELDWYDTNADYYFKSSTMLKQLLKNTINRGMQFFSLPHILVGLLSFALIVTITKIF